ncbi:UTRA domain-containing protein [Clostridium beijerinckii]|uniref:UTRA domain-containing protein n=1 Tax=Clostridium beijerinckii TaxID=1520 RepID=UPI00047C36C3|nr:UTRA domain-containing protein [Clostridium beijerinckii]
MPNVKFKDIYHILKSNIDNGKYDSSMMLPTEMELVDKFKCSRNTVRRAINELSKDGYVKSVKGKGVIILESRESIELPIGNLLGLQELHTRKKFTTSVVHFSKITIDESLSRITALKLDTEVYHLHRIRFYDNEPIILDVNYFSADVAKDLTIEIAQNSVYEYIEKDLNTKILASKKIIVVEHATELDKRFLDLGTYDCVAVVKTYAYTDSGKLFEYTESRHRPDKFVFVESSSLRKNV